MTYDLPSQHLKSQTVKTPKPYSLTAVTTDNTPNHLIKHNYSHLANTHHQRNTASSATRKAAGHPNTQEKNVMNQRRSSRTDLTATLTDTPSNISLSMREQIIMTNLMRNL